MSNVVLFWCILFTLRNRKLSDKSFLFCIIQLTLRSNCLVLENSPLKLDENLSLGKFFSLLFFALRIIINLVSDLLSFWKSPFKLYLHTLQMVHCTEQYSGTDKNPSFLLQGASGLVNNFHQFRVSLADDKYLNFDYEPI